LLCRGACVVSIPAAVQGSSDSAAALDACLVLQTLPITRVKRIIKQDGEVKAISTDANYAIAKAAVSSAPQADTYLCCPEAASVLQMCALVWIQVP
jgi:hypothetical protein